jgi:hypothetical protein
MSDTKSATTTDPKAADEPEPYIWIPADHVVGPVPLIAVHPDTGVALDPQPDPPEPIQPPEPVPEEKAKSTSTSTSTK